MKQLKYWRDLTKQQRAELKDKHGVKIVSFELICIIFENKLK